LGSQLSHVTSTVAALPPGADRWWRQRQWQAIGAGAVLCVIAGAVVFAKSGSAPEPRQPAPPIALAQPEKPKEPPKPEPVAVKAPEPKPPEPKPAAPPKAALKSSTASGTVDVRVIPWGEVFEGTRRLGLTPMQPVTMSPGPHLLTIVNGDMNKKKDVRVVVRAGQVVALKVDLLE
jgi:type IV secretory pathway VirB10-like protein